MTPTETAAKLRQYNQWRRGNLEGVPQPDPREIGEAIDAAVEMIERLEAAEKERDALRAKIEVMEKQEPVAIVESWANGSYSRNYKLRWFKDAAEGANLYLAPGAQPAPSAPEGWKLVPIEPTHEMMEAGEDTFVPTYTGTPISAPIDVYRAMLAATPEVKP